MPDNDMLGKFTQSLNTGSGDGIELTTFKLSATKLSVNVPVPVLVNVHELTPGAVLKCNDGDARTGDTINAITAIKINFFIIIFLLKKFIKVVIPYSVLLLRNQPTRPTPMLPSRIAPGAGTMALSVPSEVPPIEEPLVPVINL